MTDPKLLNSGAFCINKLRLKETNEVNNAERQEKGRAGDRAGWRMRCEGVERMEMKDTWII